MPCWIPGIIVLNATRVSNNVKSMSMMCGVTFEVEIIAGRIFKKKKHGNIATESADTMFIMYVIGNEKLQLGVKI